MLWILTRPPTLTGGGIGKSLEEASRMTFAEIENLLRAPDKTGNPTNPQLEAVRTRLESRRSREARLSMQSQIMSQEKKR